MGRAGDAPVDGNAAVDGNADGDALILVDANDRSVGSLSKARCHEGGGVLHRAFSLFILNEAGEVLLQQRAAGKRLWPLYWSNSCCSHPRVGESLEEATRRRLREELELACELQFVYKFEYRAQYDSTGAEHELCSVYVGRTAQRPRPNAAEIQALRWVAPGTLTHEMADPGAVRFTPWFVLEWRRLWDAHRDLLVGPA